MDKMRQLELELMKPSIPDFNVGDTVDVHYLIKEGDKERVQLFTGTVISIRGSGIRRSALVRRLVAGEGVERVFPLHSPRVQDITVKSKGRARRAKLFYLRDRVGKAVKLRSTFGKQRGARSLTGRGLARRPPIGKGPTGKGTTPPANKPSNPPSSPPSSPKKPS